MMHLDVLKHETPGAATKLASVTHGYLARPSLTFTTGGIMYPKVIWQDIVSVRGYDRLMRVVQTSDDESFVEWSNSNDAMGQRTWTEYGEPSNEFYNALVGDMMRKAVSTAIAAPQPALIERVFQTRKIGLIKLVRTATQQYMKSIGQGDASYMGLKDAKDLVEKWIDQDGAL